MPKIWTAPVRRKLVVATLLEPTTSTNPHARCTRINGTMNAICLGEKRDTSAVTGTAAILQPSRQHLEGPRGTEWRGRRTVDVPPSEKSNGVFMAPMHTPFDFSDGG